MILPKRLLPGDLIAFISPSAPHSSLFPKRLHRAVDFFEKKGYYVKLGRTMNLNVNGRAGSIEERINDIHEQFLDSQVKAIISSSGGLYCNELLQHLDYELISKNPKIFCGYSDNTLLSAALLMKSQLVTFYGPCVIPEFGEYPSPFDYTIENFFAALSGRVQSIEPAGKYTDKFVNWFDAEEKARELEHCGGYQWPIPGKAKGRLVGGCMPSLQQIAGTPFDFDYEGALLFLDIPEGDVVGRGTPPTRIDSLLSDFILSGKIEKINGIIIGRLFRQSSEDENKIIDIFRKRLKVYEIPLLYGLNISHGDPKITLPFWSYAKIDSSKNKFQVLEQGVK
jgi:muramoyltetrapeptide carboxypeptidase